MDISTIRISGPLSEYLEGISSELLVRGYTVLSSKNLLRLVAHFSRWLEQEGISLAELSSEQVEQFFEHRKSSGYTQFHTMRVLEPAFSYLEQIGATSFAKVMQDSERNTFERFIDTYSDYLLRERGLVPGTVYAYVSVAETFLRPYFNEDETFDVSSLKATELSEFVLQEVRNCSKGYAKCKVTALRSVLRYLYVYNHTSIDLSVSVPSVANSKYSSLPKMLNSGEARSLLKSCDRRTQIGRRDYAAMLLMIRLGLRVGEVAALELEDIYWSHGKMLVKGKGNQRDHLPLPKDVGEALASYLQSGRPAIASRKVFARSRAPYRALSVSGLQNIVLSAARRAGLHSVHAHRLRHTTATEMLRHRVPLSDIAQVLRHRHLDSTAIYAKVDRQALRTLVQPWGKGGVS